MKIYPHPVSSNYCSSVSSACSECGGIVEPTVVSGIVSLKRRRSGMASGRVSAIRAETCVRCGYTRLFAERPERLFSDLHRDHG